MDSPCWRWVSPARRHSSGRCLSSTPSRLSKEKVQKSGLIRAKPGSGGGTFAHPVIGLAYAEFLSPDFHIWCNERLLESGLYSQKEKAKDFDITILR